MVALCREREREMKARIYGLRMIVYCGRGLVVVGAQRQMTGAFAADGAFPRTLAPGSVGSARLAAELT